MKILEHLKRGVLTENPVFVQLLGLCPALATSATLLGAFCMGVSVTVVLICSNLLISLMRSFIPKKIRIVVYIVVIAGFVTAVEMILNAYFNSVYNSLGVFVPLIAANCLIMARAESYASKNKPLPGLLDGLFMGLGFTVALSLLGFVRELLGNGTVLGHAVFGGVAPLSILALPAGGFLVLGFIVALVQHLIKCNKGGDES